jgi:putative Ca2+/H+ antiporter (TMEM165/GDT1 family)
MIIYAVTVLAFILVELIDKTGQVIFNLVLNNPLSISLFGSIVLGTLIANTPVIFFGTYVSNYLPKNINVIFVSVIVSLLAFQIIMS